MRVWEYGSVVEDSFIQGDEQTLQRQPNNYWTEIPNPGMLVCWCIYINHLFHLLHQPMLSMADYLQLY